MWGATFTGQGCRIWLCDGLGSFFIGGLLCVNLIGCSLGDLVTGNPLPSDAQDPNAMKTPVGALGSYYAALIALATATRNVVMITGLLTDELQSGLARSSSPVFPSNREALMDARTLSQGIGQWADGGFVALQIVRGSTHEAIGALRKYHLTAPTALVGHLQAVEGMAEVLLAEIYCSGIPLSTLDFEGDITIKAGSSSEEVFKHAVILFDSALISATDSIRIMHFARLGRARALLALQDYGGAARAVRDVPTIYKYEVSYTDAVGAVRSNGFERTEGEGRSVADSEGINGLPFRSSHDVRTLSDSIRSNVDFANMGRWVPRKYLPPGAKADDNPGTVPIILASGIEARLIEAEAALARNDASWLPTLNTLRTTCLTLAGCPTPAPAGTGALSGLPPLLDPGAGMLPLGKTAHDVRVDLLFQERAYWLFLTGHRQGDLRRLVRQYGRNQATVYPIGPWGIQPLSDFGFDVNLPVPDAERIGNPIFRGCFNRDA